MLIAQMVGRNETDRYLRQVLSSLHKYVDDIIFTDDCSDDETALMAALYGARVYKTPMPLFNTNEHALRSFAWANLTRFARPGDWILSIDCDEILYGYERLPELMDQTVYDVLGIRFFHMWNETQFRIDKAWAPTLSHRLYRYYEGGEFKNKRLACGAEPTYVEELIRQRKVWWETGLNMKHLGYLRDDDKYMKYKRYMELDAGQFHSRTHLESIIDPDPTLVDWGFDEAE